jgi:5-(carboxyamino)imidazole ribonucleotide mutase
MTDEFKTNNYGHSSQKNFSINSVVVSIAAPSVNLLNKIKETRQVLELFQVPYSVSIVAAHRAPKKTLKYISELETNGIEVVIACGSGSAHLPGMIASLTSIPVIGIPLSNDTLGGIDSLFSMLQMPAGVPVATVGIASSYNAAIMACQILSLKYSYLKDKLRSYKDMLEQQVEKEDNAVNS